jgi:outer membrane protein assembly factor BamB
VVSLDARTGVVRWRFAAGPPLPLPWGHESGDYFASSPVVAGEIAVVGAEDGRIHALDVRTGRRRWSFATGGQVWSSPAVAGGRVFVGSGDGHVYCLDLTSGSLRWKFATLGASLESSRFGFDRRTVQSSPAVVDGTVFVGARDGFLYAIASDSGTLRWRFDHKSSWVVTSPAVHGGVVYAGSSDAAFVQALDMATGRELWHTPIGAIVWSSPAVSGDVLYVGDGVGRIHALDRRTGATRWTFRTGESVHSSPAVADGVVVFGSADGGVYALRTSDDAPQRVVFFDSTLRRAASGDAELITRFFGNRGYQRVDAAALASFLDARVADRRPSVVVFAVDLVLQPAQLRRYLDAGGKVIWSGDPPSLWPRDPVTGKRGGYEAIDWTAPERIIGVDHRGASFDEHAARPTSRGLQFALTPQRSDWGIDPRQVTEALMLDDWGQATSWVREYGGKPGTGFFRVPGRNLLAMYLLAEYRP